MLRNIITINTEKCDGCGLCASACHEGAIGMRDGKAVLLRDDFCDGLGDCLPVCPAGAIAFETREALPYDEAAVKRQAERTNAELLPCGCPGTNARVITREETALSVDVRAGTVPSYLKQWPVQLKLVPENAPYFANADLLVSADCAAYAHGNFHEAFMRNKITLIGCPKLDAADYSEKLTVILTTNSIRSLTVVRMAVPCCGGLEKAVTTALQNCGKRIPRQVATLSTDGGLVGE
jgi:ferredoxin